MFGIPDIYICGSLAFSGIVIAAKREAPLSGRIGKVVVSHAAVARSSPAEIAPIYTMHEALREYCP